MTDRKVHSESNFSRFNAYVFGAIVLAMLLAATYQFFGGSVGSDPASNTFLLVMAGIMAAIGINFSTLQVAADDDGIEFGYGFIRQRVSWDRVEDASEDSTSALMYGGWGIRLGRVGGRWRVVYNIPGYPRVVLRLGSGWYREVAISTSDPHRLLRVISSLNPSGEDD